MNQRHSLKQAENGLPKNYFDFLGKLKSRIHEAQMRAAVKVTQELTSLYWDIGSTLLKAVREANWGSKALKLVSQDLGSLFPAMKGFSESSLGYMKRFAEAYPEVQELPVLEIPWGHNMVLLDKLSNHKERIWYAERTIKNGWSRSLLGTWIDSDLYERQGKAISNFARTLPEPQSDLAREILKDPFNFKFLTLREKYLEQELEAGLMEHIQNVLLELGTGFAFVGRQYKVQVDGSDYFIDMLFYHTKLRCYCVVELKATDFRPEFAGMMSFYLSAVDDLVRHPDDLPTIGMILCKSKKGMTVEYALRNLTRPVGVADYEVNLLESLPDELRDSLPTPEQIEHHLHLNLPASSIKGSSKQVRLIKARGAVCADVLDEH